MHIQHSRTFKHQYGQDIPTVFFRRMRALHAVHAICHTLYQCCLLTCSRRSKSHSCFGGQGCWRQCTRWLRSHVKSMSCDVMWCYWRFIWCHVLPFFYDLTVSKSWRFLLFIRFQNQMHLTYTMSPDLCHRFLMIHNLICLWLCQYAPVCFVRLCVLSGFHSPPWDHDMSASTCLASVLLSEWTVTYTREGCWHIVPMACIVIHPKSSLEATFYTKVGQPCVPWLIRMFLISGADIFPSTHLHPRTSPRPKTYSPEMIPRFCCAQTLRRRSARVDWSKSRCVMAAVDWSHWS